MGTVRFDYFRPPSLLTQETDGYTALQLGKPGNRAYWPLNIRYGEFRREQTPEGGTLRGKYHERVDLLNFNLLGLQDGYAEVLRDACYPEARDGRVRIVGGEPISISVAPLNVSNHAPDVRYRQAVVRELGTNPELASALEHIVQRSGVVQSFQAASNTSGHLDYLVTSMDRVTRVLDRIAALERFAPESEALQRAIAWAKATREHPLLHYYDGRVDDVFKVRIFVGYGRRNARPKAYLVPPGFEPDEHLIPLHTEVLGFEKEVSGSRKRKVVQRDLFKYLSPQDADQTMALVGQGVANLNALNEIVARMLAVPIATVLGQLEQYTLAQRWHNKLRELGVPATFPTIRDAPGVVHTERLYSPSLIMHALASDRRPSVTPVDLHVAENPSFIGIEGRNAAGKTEAARALHTLSLLTNLGAPLPCAAAEIGPVTASHFFSFRDTGRYYGSAFASSMEGFLRALPSFIPNGRVILDEFGDATNEPTARELAARVFPLFAQQRMQVILTMQHSAARSVIASFGGETLTPLEQPDFQLGPVQGPVDYKPAETLDALGVTVQKLAEQLPLAPRACPPLPPVFELGHGTSVETGDPSVDEAMNQHEGFEALESRDEDLPF